MRNPLLAGVGLAGLGAAIATRSWWLLAGTVLLAIAAHLWVVHVEEPRLRARFGEAYAEYLRHVPRWLPHRTRRPEELR